MKVEFYKHNVSESDADNVLKVLRSPILTTGSTVEEFEKDFSQYLGCNHTVGVTSCTAALHLSLVAYGIGPGHEVITTPMTFIATANAVLHAGARPVFVDVEPKTGNLNADLVEAAITKQTRAIMPVHLYGHMCDMRKIRAIADKHRLVIIEDAAHAIEARRDGVVVGELGNLACFSFYATKNITCGEGGAVCTNNLEMAEKLRKLRLHGMNKGAGDRYSKKYEHWDMEILGWKYNMDNIQASLLLNQLKCIDKWWQRRESICIRYEQAFKDHPSITCLEVLPMTRSARHLFTILVPSTERDKVLARLQEKEIGVAVNYRAIHLLTYYREAFGYERGSFPVAEDIGDRTITLPLYPRLEDGEVEYVIESVREAVK